MRFYLDQCLSQVVAVIARGMGVDVISSHEVDRDGTDDDVQLLYAAEQGRCIVTRNYADYERWTHEFQEQGLPHRGVLLVPSSLPNDQFYPLARAIARYAREHPDDMPAYMIDYLRPVSDSDP
jgi:uncharacterized protein with PIN domain